LGDVTTMKGISGGDQKRVQGRSKHWTGCTESFTEG